MFLLIDIGGTKIRLATSKDGKTLEEPVIINTVYEFSELISTIHKKALEVTQGEKIEAIAVGTRGMLDSTKSYLTDRRVFHFENVPLKQALTDSFGVPVFLENDAALAALGEAIYGAGKEFSIVGFYTISTGIGGARVVNQSIDINALGFEPGKQIVDSKEGVSTILEDKISGEALKKLYQKTGENILDPYIWDSVAKDLAVGVNNAIVFWSPEVIVLGGSVMKSVDTGKVRKYAKELRKINNFPSIKKATLGEESGLYGALAYLNSKNS